MAGTTCSYDPLTITGRVVDESGTALSNVSVRACYSGWGWGEAGYLVWDKDYCSDATQTNLDGFFSITFQGPASSRLRAKKTGWVQTRSFNVTDSRIVLTRREDYSARLKTEARQRDLEQQRHLAGETATAYYCRVVLAEAHNATLTFQSERLAVTPTILASDNPEAALFAVRGSIGTVEAFAEEMVLQINGVTQDGHFSLQSANPGCSQGVYFIAVDLPGLNAWPDSGVEMLVPAIKAMFEARIQSLSAQ